MDKDGWIGMDHEKVLATIHLHAFLPILEEVAEKDEKGRRIAAEMSGALQFNAWFGPSAYLVFHGERVEVFPGRLRNPELCLSFTSCRQLNKAFQKKGIPAAIPWRGLSRKDLREGFEGLAERGEYYLTASKEHLGASLPLAAELLLYVGILSGKVVAEEDPVGRSLLEEIPDGVAEFRIGETGPFAHVRVEQGRLYAGKGPALEPDFRLAFGSPEVAHDFLNDRLDAMATLAGGQVRVEGFLPLVQGLLALMERAALYVE